MFYVDLEQLDIHTCINIRLNRLQQQKVKEMKKVILRNSEILISILKFKKKLCNTNAICGEDLPTFRKYWR